ncbi:type II toxin-antitoxin system HicA family toxin [Kyrpidia tusciae]|uniref:YcfA family protein n=1 Tax=Kyrpidia tusciae (strain DSM 2912 / NBRC 15312 / T2) TaxID=562970 RepID=D5WVN2_KYRT2|nr:type II toxin-antitoxin system HicA family toxin [Kyrpidia tusciae]ADG07575.1 YcfA family protein [Kyrpidia tusciae DSM 2912]
MKNSSSRDLIKIIQDDGWYYIGSNGSHHQFKPPTKPGKATIPHPRKELAPKTVKSILKQAGLLK